MIRLLIFLALLIAGLIAGPWLIGDTGYVLIALGHYTVESSVVMLAVVVALVLILVWCLDWLVRRLYRTLGRGRHWLGDRSGRRANKKASKAWQQLWLGQYRKSAAALAVAAEYAPLPDFPRLAAAYAAHKAQDLAERDRLLEQLQQPLAAPAMLLHLGDISAACLAFDSLSDELRQSKAGEQLSARLALARGDMAALWPHIDALADTERDQYFLPALSARIAVATDEGSEALSRLEQVLDKHSRERPEVIAALAHGYAKNGQQGKAHDQLLAAAKRHPQAPVLDALVALSDQESAAKTQRQLLKWHHKRDHDPVLLAALGMLSEKQHELPEARRYLEAALALRDDHHWRLALAKLLVRMGQNDQALQHFQALH